MLGIWLIPRRSGCANWNANWPASLRSATSLKKVGHFLENTRMKYQFIDDYRSSFGVEKMCRLCIISQSGFYRWSQTGESKRAIENRLLRG